MVQVAGGMPLVKVSAGGMKRARAGHPWIFSNEIEMTPELKSLVPGTLVEAEGGGQSLGIYGFNPHTLIAGRKLSAGPARAIDAAFLTERIAAALTLRERLFDAPYYRLIHAEADGLPGLIIDRFGDTLVLQANAAVMDRLRPEILAALEAVVAPGRVIFKNDSPARTLEGLELGVEVVTGAASGPVELIENGCRFICDPVGGQKTGWFFDHRDNRAFMARLAKGARVADFYCYAGSFSVQCAVAGAAHVTGIDRSEGALELAARSAALNGVAERTEFRRAEAFAEMERLCDKGELFDIVIADPPAFIKSKKQLAAGLRGYRKMTKLAARLVRPSGFLLVASCSHHADPASFAHEVRQGLIEARRVGRIIRTAGAAPDHPVHQALPESAYLKAEVHQLD